MLLVVFASVSIPSRRFLFFKLSVWRFKKKKSVLLFSFEVSLSFSNSVHYNYNAVLNRAIPFHVH